MALGVVYLPMVPGDEREAAVGQARRFHDPRAATFWDEPRLTGRTWGARDKQRLWPTLVQLLPPGSEERAVMEAWDPEEQPVWDVAWFYTADATWPAGELPEQAVWCKQFGWSGGAPGANGFFRGEGWEAEIAWSSWEEEFGKGMEAVAARRPNDLRARRSP